MSNDQKVLVSMDQYGIDFSISLSLATFSSLICMIGHHIDHGPDKVEVIREDVLSKVVLLVDLLDRHPEMREDKGFYNEYFMTLCVVLLALDVYLEGRSINISSVLELIEPMKAVDIPVNPNFEKFFH